MKTMTTEEKVRALRADFLDRDPGTFVHIRRTGRLGWESLIPEGGSYSDMMMDPSATAHDKIRAAYAKAKDLLVAMDTPYRVTVRLSPDRSCTDSEVVYVATQVFDDADLTDGQRTDTFLGLAIHEGCHLRWTDFGEPRPRERVVADLRNIIEDERIERLCGEEMPGYANFLVSTKYWYFDKYASEAAARCGEAPSDGVRLLNAILALVRYPKAMKEADLVEFAPWLYDVREVLLDFPRSTSEAGRAAERIWEIIRDFYRSKDRHDGSGECSPSGGAAPDGGAGEGSPSGGGSSCAAETAASDLSPALDAMESAVRDSTSREDTLKVSDMASAVREDSCLLAEECEGKAERAGDGAVFRKEKDNPERYRRALAEVRRHIPSISRALQGHCQEYMQVYRGMRSGALDTSKLAEAFQGVQTVYVKEGLVRSSRLAVCILVDESGSMIREERMTSARKLAVLLNEAVSRVPGIELFIYGHSADETVEGRTDLRVYRERGYTPKHSLGSLEARDNNRDGTAILQTALRVRRQTRERILMFVISDGAPAAQGYIGREAIAHTRSCVEQVEKMGIPVCQVAIQASYDPGTMFRRFVRYDDMQTFAPEFARMVKKAIMENTRREG